MSAAGWFLANAVDDSPGNIVALLIIAVVMFGLFIPGLLMTAAGFLQWQTEPGNRSLKNITIATILVFVAGTILSNRYDWSIPYKEEAQEGAERAFDFTTDALVGFLALATNQLNNELYQAIADGDSHKLEMMIRFGADANAAKTEYDDETALMKAAMSWNSELVQILIDAGANTRAQRNNGWTALMYAARTWNDEAVEAIVGAGADVDAKGPDGRTALILATQSQGFEDAWSRRYGRVSDADARKAALAARIANVTALIGAEADVNARTNDGRSAMSIAQDQEDTVIIEILMQAGASQL